MPNHYETLGIPRGATADEIRRAYRDQAKQLHPDHARAGEAPMVALNQAYEVLRDPGRRAAYDASLSYSLPPRGPRPAWTGAIDPRVFVVKVFAPADLRVRQALAALETALEELAYDIYDEAHLARFEVVLERAESAVAEVHRELWHQAWPANMDAARGLYGQGLRLAEDALADFRAFTENFDVDGLALACDILAQGNQQLGDVRASMDRGL